MIIKQLFIIKYYNIYNEYFFFILVILLIGFLVLNKTKENFQENEKPLLFIHIPKTGGTYVEEELEKFINKYKLNVKLSKEKNQVKKKNFTLNDLTKESKNIIKNYYKRDFKLLGYNFNL